MTFPFSQIFLINLASRKDRLEQMIEQKIRTQDGQPFTIIEACTPEKAIEKSPFVAFNTSQLWALQSINTYPAMILEDDCVFTNCQHLESALSELPESGWDCLYLGANLLGIDIIPFKPPTRYSNNLFIVNDAWMTHAIVYSKDGVDKILNKFKVNCGWTFDEFLRQEIIPDGRCFIIAPQIAYQRASYSDIWNVQANFEHLYSEGNKLLK